MDTAEEFQALIWALNCCEAEGYGAQWVTEIHALIKDWNTNGDTQDHAIGTGHYGGQRHT